jgi:hypothetical protein
VKKIALMIAAGTVLIAAVVPASADNMAPRDAKQTRSVESNVRDANAHMHHHWHHHMHHHHRM